jgi:hypothetical protein
MTNHSDDIDLAARAMTDIEPPNDLEARIKRRLDTEVLRAQPRWRPAYWIGAAGLTAAAALLALLVVQGPTGPARRSLGEGGSKVQGSIEVQGSEGPRVQGSAGSEVLEPAVSLSISSSPHLPVSSPVRLPAYRTMSESEMAWMSRRVDALDLIDPIQPERVSITPLTMTPLMTSPMFGMPNEWQQ